MYNLIGIDGNAFSVMAYVSNAMKEQGFSPSEVNQYRKLAMTSDYQNLLNTSAQYIEQCNNRIQKQEDLITELP